jgi:hypothetical protein
MRRFSLGGLLGLALFVLSNERASAGSVHVNYTKAEVQAARIKLYEHEMALRDADPTRFDQHRPVLGRILASEQGFDSFLAKHTFPRLLCVHTPFIWRVVDGDILYHKIHPFAEPPSVPDLGPPFPGGETSDNIPPGSGGPPGGGGSGTTVHVASVPEPSSWVILATGVTLALIAALRRRMGKGGGNQITAFRPGKPKCRTRSRNAGVGNSRRQCDERPQGSWSRR